MNLPTKPQSVRPVSHRPRVSPLRTFALCLASALGLAPVVSHAQNLLQNSSFEAPLGGSNNWVIGQAGAPTATVATDATQFHWEEQSVKMTYTGSQQPGVYKQVKQTVSGLTVGKTYYAYVWAKGQSVGAGTNFVIQGASQATTALPTGNFDWQLFECSFTADQTSLVVGVTLHSTTGSLWIDDVYLTEYQRKDVSTLGIPGNNTDVTTAIGAALNTHKFLYFPPGTYRVSGIITMPKGAIIQGAGDSTIFNQVADGNSIFRAFGNDTTFMGDNEYTAFKVIGGVIPSSYNPSKYIAHYKTAKNVLMRHCTADPGNLIFVTTHKSTYADITSEDQLSANIRVAFCTGIGPNVNGIVEEQACIRFRYTIDSEIYKNNLSFYGTGIGVWGGNASFGTGPNNNGAMTNPRWARRFYIAGNVANDMVNAGIFISMGQYITAEFNNTHRSDDISLDFEGCFDSVAQDNIASDGLNGAIANFYGTKNMVFRRNLVTSNIEGYPLYRMYNSSYVASNVQDVVLEDNVFISYAGLSSVDDFKGPGNITIRNNTFTNAVIDISHRGMGTSVPGPTITGNELNFTLAMTDPATAINVKVAAGDTTIENNRITWTNTTGRSTKTGIMYRRVLTAGQTINVRDNYILGCGAAGIDIYHPQPNVTAVVEDNQVGSTIYVGAQGQVTLNASNNQNLSGGANPPVWVP
ncbi:MAG: right-handed parallel beta-helix repeat-containing protein [Verrucomicrobiota bacterium JB022]|nr:right-handed parallel beta-helix repeat-containing protein [Verrucomicrobiota bacterium JB022]